MSTPFYNTFDSQIGTLYLIVLGNKLSEIRIGGKQPPHKKDKVPDRIREQLSAYFDGRLREFNCRIVLDSGTDFERKVWLSLKKIPYGETRSYKWLAEEIGNPKGVRAVGRALSRNPIPIILPCHRIIESDGSIGGYSSGTDIKRRLLDLEYYTLHSSK